MSTSFNFPANPTLNQIVVLPNGTQAQWNGTAWVSVSENVTYPLEIPKGGTGATNPSTARVNLGLNFATGEFMLDKDGTALLPGLAFKSEPGLGWYRSAASGIAMAAQGAVVSYVTATNAANTAFGLIPRAAGVTNIELRNHPGTDPGTNQLLLQQNANGSALIGTAGFGTFTRGNLLLDAPQILFNDGTVAAPNISFASEPGLGFYRSAAGIINIASGGAVSASFDSTGATQTNTSFTSRTAGGVSILNLGTAPPGSANRNILQFFQNADGSARIATTAVGTATRGNLTLDAPQVYMPGGTLGLGPLTTGGITLLLDGGSAFGKDIASFTLGQPRWYMRLGGGMPADDFILLGYTGDAGTGQATRMYIQRVSGDLSIYGNNAAKNVAGTWLANSDARIKDNIQDYTAGLAEVIQLRPRTFAFKQATGRSANGERFTSLIAQEAEAVMADLVSTAPGEVGDIKLADMRTLDITNITYALINAVKTLNQRLEAIGA